ncbi:MAG: periplasmic heavy metal sensor [Pseudomonadota bacterium]
MNTDNQNTDKRNSNTQAPGPSPAAVRTRSPIWMRALLIASLAVNAAIIGVIIGNKLNEPERRGAGQQISWILRMVPEERREFTRSHFGEVRDDLRNSSFDRIGHLERIVTVIRTEPFAAGELRAVLEVRRTSSTDRRVIVHERLVTLLEEFDPAERQVFADNLEMQLERLRRRRGTPPTLSATGSGG